MNACTELAYTSVQSSIWPNCQLIRGYKALFRGSSAANSAGRLRSDQTTPPNCQTSDGGACPVRANSAKKLDAPVDSFIHLYTRIFLAWRCGGAARFLGRRFLSLPRQVPLPPRLQRLE